MLIALIAGCMFLVLRKQAARIRYTLAVGSLVAIFILSASLRIHGFDQTTAVVNPMEEMTLGFNRTTTNDFMPEVPSVEFQDTLKKSVTSKINTHFFDASDQKEKEVKMILDGKQVKELYIDGERVPDDGSFWKIIRVLVFQSHICFSSACNPAYRITLGRSF